jgi:hypothetical protein
MLYGRLRGWAKGGVYLSLSALQMMGATLLEQGSAPGTAVPKTGKSKTLFLEDSVRQTPRPIQQLVNLTGNEVSYLDWVTGLRPVLVAREVASY